MEARNAQHQSGGRIDLEYNHPSFGWIPFTADANDNEALGRELHARAMAGEFGPIAEYVPASTPVPQIVSRFQGLAALMQAGLLDDIEAFMADPLTDPFDRLAWRSIQEFRRTSPTVARIGAIFNFTDEQLDDLFRFAATVEA